MGSHRNALHSQSWAVPAGSHIPLGADTNTPLLSAQHIKPSDTQSFPCCDLGINCHTQCFGTMTHFWARCVKIEIFTWGISAVGRKFYSIFVFKVLKIKIWALYHMVPNGSCHRRAYEQSGVGCFGIRNESWDGLALTGNTDRKQFFLNEEEVEIFVCLNIIKAEKKDFWSILNLPALLTMQMRNSSSSWTTLCVWSVLWISQRFFNNSMIYSLNFASIYKK